ncbi:helix-turn-helix domain-containing protein [Xanthomonas gardneri]|uniref:HTH cro/C1-type domain-containing protein n=1 Tax=Xanthomonas hortorum pv. gardneri TaxID=2754056 RepID=A0A6V7F8W0_9XANT|nr:hypothetical protein BJD10_02905 [Xanthomonas hortorum pv. gardneri]NMI48380.1 helix-turn-helix domain-containing protein [Xanthomonas hortorum pv. gardneri]CAD0359850.1 hypothetical protein CFBP8129_44220 [Xanthomonas hortorum pv. gardneri]CAD0359855.1 hypothetical protein CFBP8129_44220 [Xanthomonas hortorum pv. gardneri]CAH2710469.1 HTH cro/C1-type domain-containing protein [Xanthomonas campestris pv. nigromaculans]
MAIRYARPNRLSIQHRRLSPRSPQGLRRGDLATLAGTSHVVLGNVERGKDTVQLGRVFELLRQLGIPVQLDLPLELPAPVDKRLK